MARRVGKHKVSTREYDLFKSDENVATATTYKATDYISALGGVYVGADSDPGTDNLVVDGTSTLTGKITATGGIDGGAYGVVAGADGVTRGKLTLWDGGGGNTPAYILMHSRNGTANYLFFEDDGTLKRHTAEPAANGDGSCVGDQTD